MTADERKDEQKDVLKKERKNRRKNPPKGGFHDDGQDEPKDEPKEERKEERLTISQWAEEDRPREKMMQHGAAALSNAELLAILVGSGSHEDSAVGLMRKVLDRYGNSLSRLGKCGVEELCRFKGIGPAKAVTILAASELGKRRKEEEPQQRQAITCSTDLYAYFHPLMCALPVEECWVLLLNQAAKVIDAVKISQGGLASTQVDVRCVLREALLRRATSLALAHNHPSGSCRPSADDDRLTQALATAAKTLNLRLLDHIVVTDGRYYSYSDEGKL